MGDWGQQDASLALPSVNSLVEVERNESKIYLSNQDEVSEQLNLFSTQNDNLFSKRQINELEDTL